MVQIVVNGQRLEAEEDHTVLEVLRHHQIKVPTLCYHPALKPSGSCKLCSVEVVGKSGRPTAMLSCILKVRDGLEVQTEGEVVAKARARAFRNLLQMAPQSRHLLDLAAQFGIDTGPPPDGCVRCRLCIRVCKEIIGAAALRMETRDGRPFVAAVEGHCIGCGTCANICPTKVIQVSDRDGIRTISIRDEVIGIHALERCDACGTLFATRKFLQHAAEHSRPHPDLKEHHHYCPTCAKLMAHRVQLGLSQKQR